MILVINSLYRLILHPSTFLLVYLSYALILFNLVTVLRTKILAGLNLVLGFNLTLNIVFLILNIFNLVNLVDIFISASLLALFIGGLIKKKINYLSLYIPLATIIGVYIGFVVGIEYPLKYSLLGILDLSSSQLIEEGDRKETILARTLSATALYTSPMYFVGILACLYNILLFILKNVSIYKGHLITGLDIMFKPMVYGLKPWI